VTGEILASHQQGTGNITHLLMEDSQRVSVEPIDRPQLFFHGETGARIDIVYPILTPAAKTFLNRDAPPPTVGYVRLGLSLQSSQLLLAALARSAAGLALGITLLMVPVGYELVRNVVGPLSKIGDAARRLAKGSMDVRVESKRRDEVGQLTTTFNMMADELASSHGKLVELNAELEDRVAKRTQALEAANERLKELAARDALTGLYNRRHFNDLLGQLFAESTRYHSDLTLMMLDLDNFKWVNDTLGHQTGDKLLRMTADVILQCIRESDVAVRYGGDEFIILWPQTSPAEARASAERILARFRSDLAREIPEANIASLSIGVASRQLDEPAEAMQLVRLADEALYLAKAGGKDRITVLQPVASDLDSGDTKAP
jgi:diguanylate cyclase (GGDEF)-like protein